MTAALQPQTSPTDGYSDLTALVSAMIRRYGDFSARRIDGDVVLMCLDLANEIVELINAHPYWDADPVAYYTAITDKRPIPDIIMARGLLAKYAEQQGSKKYPNSVRIYINWLNTALYTRRYGGSQPIELAPMDGGSNPAYNTTATS